MQSEGSKVSDQPKECVFVLVPMVPICLVMLCSRAPYVQALSEDSSEWFYADVAES
jgi:hypothetical protein